MRSLLCLAACLIALPSQAELVVEGAAAYVKLDAPKPIAESSLTADQQPTPMEGVAAGIAALGPLAHKRMVVYGSGFDARWEITAARREPTLTVVGIEIDPQLAESARRYVAHAGLADRITILTGDAITTSIQADVGAAYLWPETLEQLRPKIEKLDRFVSYGFSVPGLKMDQQSVSNGGAIHIWPPAPVVVQVPVTKTVSKVVQLPRGSYCTICGRHCSNPMQHMLQQQIVGYQTKQVPANQPAATKPQPVAKSNCANGNCATGNCKNGNCNRSVSNFQVRRGGIFGRR